MLTIQYDGSGFSGWQRQPEVRTVQGELERALSCLMGKPVTIHGTSRTDAGVHALGQQASFRGEFGIPTEKIQKAVNHLLAGKGGGLGKMGRMGDVQVVDVREMPLEFHARFDAKGKLYRYIIANDEKPDIFRRRYCYQVEPALDVEAMKEAAGYIVGAHDFQCFQSSGSTPRETTVRTVHGLQIERVNYENRQGHRSDIVIEIAGDGFLYNMVRIITGTLVEVGLGKRPPENLKDVIDGCDRRLAGHTAPAEGLYLVKVFY